MSNYEKLCNLAGVFDTASHSSSVQRAHTQVLLLARRSAHRGFISCARWWTTLRSSPLWGTGDSHQNTPQTKYQDEWCLGISPENQNLENMLLLYCTPITWGREQRTSKREEVQVSESSRDGLLQDEALLNCVPVTLLSLKR